MRTQNSTAVDIQQFALGIMMRYIKLCKGNIFSQEIEKVSELDPKSLFFHILLLLRFAPILNWYLQCH